MKTRRLISICVCMLWAIFASAYDFSEKNEDGVMLYYTNLEAGFCEVAQGPDDYKGKLVILQVNKIIHRTRGRKKIRGTNLL